MSETKEAEKKTERMVAIINKGGSIHQTSQGPLPPGQSIEIPESEAKKLCAYMHIVLASSVVKGIAGLDTLRKENMELKATVKNLEDKLSEFFKAGSKKDLEALQDKYNPAPVPASEKPE
jgi:hypothetical protein